MTRILLWPLIAIYCLWLIIVTVLAIPWLLTGYIEARFQGEM